MGQLAESRRTDSSNQPFLRNELQFYELENDSKIFLFSSVFKVTVNILNLNGSFVKVSALCSLFCFSGKLNDSPDLIFELKLNP